MSRRMSLDPAGFQQQGVLSEISPNRTNQRANIDKQRRKSSLAAYASMYGKGDDTQGEERDEGAQDGGTFGQQRQTRRMSGSMARPRGGVLGGSLQDNITGEFGGMHARSARKINRGTQQQQTVEMIPMMSLEGGGRASIIMMNDPRNFNSIEGRNYGIRKVVEFLANRGYAHPISEKDLVSPQVAVFREILISIASLIDPYTTEEIALKIKSKGQWEMSVIQFFKSIRYPFNLSPKQIASVGSANAWPKFLGALVWLTELIDVGEFQVETALFRNDERKAQMDALRLAYKKYMDGDDGAIEQLLLKLRASVDAQGMQLKRQVVEAEAKVKELKTHLNRMNGVASGDTTEDATTSFTSGASRTSVESLKIELETLRSDARKVAGAIETWRRKAEMARNSAIAEERKVGSLQRELEELRTKREAEQRKLDTQVLKNSDLSRIAAERNRLEKTLEEMIKEKEIVSGRVWSSSQQLDQLTESLQGKIVALNSRCVRIAQKGKEKRFSEVTMNAFVNDAASIVEPCHEYLSLLFHRFLEMADDARRRSLELQDQSDRNAEECDAIESQIEVRKREIKRLDEKHREDSERLALELDQLDRETRTAQKQLDSALESGMRGEEEEEVSHLKLELEKQGILFVEQRKQVEMEINACLQVLVDFKLDAESMVNHVQFQVDAMVSKSDQAIRLHQQILPSRS